MNTPAELFCHCPRCGARRAPCAQDPCFICLTCSFTYYFNPTVAAAAIILRPDGAALWIRRAKDPAKGKLAMVGGFIDVGETAEAALRREVREEVNLDLASLEYLCSQTNEYRYKEVTYPVLDLFFVARVNSAEDARALDGVESFCWLRPEVVDVDDVAFESMKRALESFRSRG